MEVALPKWGSSCMRTRAGHKTSRRSQMSDSLHRRSDWQSIWRITIDRTASTGVQWSTRPRRWRSTSASRWYRSLSSTRPSRSSRSSAGSVWYDISPVYSTHCQCANASDSLTLDARTHARMHTLAYLYYIGGMAPRRPVWFCKITEPGTERAQACRWHSAFGAVVTATKPVHRLQIRPIPFPNLHLHWLSGSLKYNLYILKYVVYWETTI